MVTTMVARNWQAKGRIYETAPHSFEIDVSIDSDDEPEKVADLIRAAQKGCFIEQTLGVTPSISTFMLRLPL